MRQYHRITLVQKLSYLITQSLPAEISSVDSSPGREQQQTCSSVSSVLVFAKLPGTLSAVRHDSSNWIRKCSDSDVVAKKRRDWAPVAQ